MSLICGAWLRRPGAAFPDGWDAHLRQQVKRGAAGSVSEYRDDRLLLYKLDIDAFDAPAWRVGMRHVTAIAGDAIFTADPEIRGRADDMAAIDGMDVARLDALLARSRGYFNLVHYDRDDHRLALATDRVGVRSLYVYDDGETLVFAGALRLIETLPGIRLTVDLRAVMETASVEVPLAARTHYKEVRCLPGGSRIVADDGQVLESRYWRFDRDACTHLVASVDAGIDQLYATFQEAVALRAGRRKAVFSALSGGLDSRSVTTELWRRGLDVHSVNVSWKDSQDEVLSALFAKELGLTHHAVQRPLSEAGNTLAQRLQVLIAENAARCPDLPSTPRQMWSGNGGSLGLGHTKMSTELSEKLRARDLSGAAESYMRSCRFSLRGTLLKPAVAQWAENVPRQGIVAELEQLECHEPERAMYVFRVENDQRRILAFHFEQIDLVPFEFIEPLFDPEVLSVVCTLPMEFCLKHHMYHRWLERFPPEIMSVGWQVYPGHEPCPVPLPAAAFNQWKPPRRHRRGTALLPATRDAWRYLRRLGRFQPVLRAHRVLAAYAARGLEIRDTSYLLRQVDLLGASLAHASGGIDVPAECSEPA